MTSSSSPSDYYDPSDLPLSPYDHLLLEARTAALAACCDTSLWRSPSLVRSVKVFTSALSLSSSFASSKGEALIEASPEVIADSFASPTQRPQWDPMMESAELMDRVDRLTGIVHSTFKAPWPVQKRDFVLIGRVERVDVPHQHRPPHQHQHQCEGKGSLLFYGKSIPSSLYPFPVTSSVTRAELHYFALLVEPIRLDLHGPPSSRVVYATSSDIKGLFPRWVINAAQTMQPLCLAGMEQFLKGKNVKEKVQQGLNETYLACGFDTKVSTFQYESKLLGQSAIKNVEDTSPFIKNKVEGLIKQPYTPSTLEKVLPLPDLFVKREMAANCGSGMSTVSADILADKAKLIIEQEQMTKMSRPSSPCEENTAVFSPCSRKKYSVLRSFSHPSTPIRNDNRCVPQTAEACTSISPMTGLVRQSSYQRTEHAAALPLSPLRVLQNMADMSWPRLLTVHERPLAFDKSCIQQIVEVKSSSNQDARSLLLHRWSHIVCPWLSQLGLKREEQIRVQCYSAYLRLLQWRPSVSSEPSEPSGECVSQDKEEMLLTIGQCQDTIVFDTHIQGTGYFLNDNVCQVPIYHPAHPLILTLQGSLAHPQAYTFRIDLQLLATKPTEAHMLWLESEHQGEKGDVMRGGEKRMRLALSACRSHGTFMSVLAAHWNLTEEEALQAQQEKDSSIQRVRFRHTTDQFTVLQQLSFQCLAMRSLLTFQSNQARSLFATADSMFALIALALLWTYPGMLLILLCLSGAVALICTPFRLLHLQQTSSFPDALLKQSHVQEAATDGSSTDEVLSQSMSTTDVALLLQAQRSLHVLLSLLYWSNTEASRRLLTYLSFISIVAWLCPFDVTLVILILTVIYYPSSLVQTFLYSCLRLYQCISYPLRMKIGKNIIACNV